MSALLPLAFLGLGDMEVMLILMVTLMFFGGSRMPELARGLGKALREFRRATSEVEREFKRVMDEAEHQTVAPFREVMETPAHVQEAANEAFAAAVSEAPPAGESLPAPLSTPAEPVNRVFPSPPPGPRHRLGPADPADDFHSDI